MDQRWDGEERLAVFMDYENLALGAREHLGGMQFDFGPIAAALAARGRVLVRRAYADWSYFDDDRRALTRHQVELIEMPQRMGASRKNAADIKMVVDAIEMAFEREYISTFVICTGDSDFSPLVHKLRELDRRVIGVGVEKSTSRLLPPACDEFLFYDRLEGVDVPDLPGETGSRTSSATKAGRVDEARTRPPRRRKGTGEESESSGPAQTVEGTDVGAPTGPNSADAEPTNVVHQAGNVAAGEPGEPGEPGGLDQRIEVPMEVQVAQTLADLAASSPGAVTASVLKRTLLRKDPTFSEADYGFRTFGEFLRFLAERRFVELSTGPAAGDPVVSLPDHGGPDSSFALLREVVTEAGGAAPMSGLKNQMQKLRPDFSEKALGFRGFLQFCRAAQEVGVVSLTWSDAHEAYEVTLNGDRANSSL